MAKLTLWMFVLRNWHTIWGAFVASLCLRIVIDVGTETIQFLQMLLDGKLELNWKTFLIYVLTALVSVANLILTAISTKFHLARQKAAEKQVTDPQPSI